MPRAAAEDSRRKQLIEATIETLAEEGFVATTLAEIGSRARVSPGLIAHYFSDKDGLLEATLRNLAGRLSRGVSQRLRDARTPRERVQAVIEATLAPEEFEPRTCSVWLAFWGQVTHSQRLRRVQRVYQRRMLSNLRHALRKMVGDEDAQRIAIGLAAMIDGLWLRATLSSPHETDSRMARGMASNFVDAELARCTAAKASERARRQDQARILSHIGGAYVANASGKAFATVNPATGETLAEVEIAGEAEVESAVAAARAAQPRWAAISGAERGRILRRVADLLRSRNEELSAAGDARHRQADPGDLGGRRSLGRGVHRVFRGTGGGPVRRAYRSRCTGLRLHPPRAARHRCWHWRVELPAADRLLEGGAALACGNATSSSRRNSRR